ncbi:MAG TPA: anthranilate phosphoribosyltransferase [Candidatus Omnitrophota bacterium]|mgnify:CR=1 FL=1|nr:anthranilate phosphoribosyltransferase [Candidatus Omnitrophota bacterium]
MIQRNCKINSESVLRKLLLQENFRDGNAKIFFQKLFSGSYDSNAASSALILLRERGETAEELSSLIRMLRKQSHSLKASFKHLVDNCGTGGDRKGTFNISTLSALVAAGAGARVAKHGNRSSSSGIGSTDILDALGVKTSAPAEIMLRALNSTGFGYFHAPFYHPLMQNIRELRKKIPGRTIFNLAGPLLNPVSVRRQVVGVPDSKTFHLMADTLLKLRPEHAFVVCGHGGTDEITPYGRTLAAEIKEGKIRYFQIEPTRWSFKSASAQTLKGGDLRQNRLIALGILKNEIRGARRDTVLLNAALTLVASGRATDMPEGLRLARASLDSGNAFFVLKKLIQITNS